MKIKKICKYSFFGRLVQSNGIEINTQITYHTQDKKPT